MAVTKYLVIPPVNELRHRPWKQVKTFITKCVEMMENAVGRFEF